MCAKYNVSGSIKHWLIIIFFTILKVGGIRTQIIYFGNQLEPLRKRVNLKRLAYELILGKLLQRSLGDNWNSSSLQVHLKRYRTIDNREKYSFLSLFKWCSCITCPAEISHKRILNYKCCTCYHAICLFYAIMICQSCISTSHRRLFNILTVYPTKTDYSLPEFSILFITVIFLWRKRKAIWCWVLN